MALLDVVTYPARILSKKAKEVDGVDEETKALMADMLETMYDAPGVGLAAPQVGVGKRIIVIDIGPEDERQPIMLVNPEITYSEGEFVFEEGCLSLPEFTSEIKRKKRVKVKGINQEGEEVTYDADEYLAVAFQHEIDHLDGVLLIDRVSRLKRDIYRRKVKKGLIGAAMESKSG